MAGLVAPWFPKAGRYALDPLNRVVYIERIEGDVAVCRMRGPYRATLHIPKSALRPIKKELRT